MINEINTKIIYPKQGIACVAAIVIAQKEGRDYILLQERWKKVGDVYNGRYEIPAGVLDKEYENIVDAVKREVMEEASIEVTEVLGVKEVFFDFSNGDKMLEIVPFCISQQLIGGKPYVCNAFICKADFTEPKQQDIETRNPKWVNVEDLKVMIKNPNEFFPLIYPIIIKYLNSL
jgi:8-oxo-dGTP pyrophosphatase MutT (NUDIX family)